MLRPHFIETHMLCVFGQVQVGSANVVPGATSARAPAFEETAYAKMQSHLLVFPSPPPVTHARRRDFSVTLLFVDA